MESAAHLAVLPETALAAACRPVLMVTDAVDQDCFVVIHGDSIDIVGQPLGIGSRNI